MDDVHYWLNIDQLCCCSIHDEIHVWAEQLCDVDTFSGPFCTARPTNTYLDNGVASGELGDCFGLTSIEKAWLVPSSHYPVTM